MASKGQKIAAGLVLGSAILGGALLLSRKAGAGPGDKGTLRGRVIDQDTGQPLPGVLVTLGEFNTVTGQDGTYTIADIPTGGYTLTFTLEGYTTISGPYTLAAGTNTLDISMVPSGNEPTLANLFGTVKNQAGQPIPGVTILLDSLHTVSGVNGEYGFWAINPGSYTLTFIQPGYVTLNVSITLIEGDNLKDVTMVATPVDAVTLDRFQLRCNFVPQTIDIIVTITNHTNETFRDVGYPGTMVQMWGGLYQEGREYPIDDITFRPMDTDRIGDLSPGTHTYAITRPTRYFPQGAWFDVFGIAEGVRGEAWMEFAARDFATTPAAILAQDQQGFEGIFSASFQDWVKSAWTPPPLPEY